jgi:hypothetical protein
LNVFVAASAGVTIRPAINKEASIFIVILHSPFYSRQG